MKRMFVVAVVVLALVQPAHGSWSMTQWFQSSIASHGDLLDLVELHQDDPGIRAYLDRATVWQQQDAPWGTFVRLEGWAVGCQVTFSGAHLRPNAFAKPAEVDHGVGPRLDVQSNPGLSAWCPSGLPLDSAFLADVPLDGLLPGLYYTRLRFFTATGGLWTTNAVPIQVP